MLNDAEYAQEGMYDIMKVDFVKITIHFLQCVYSDNVLHTVFAICSVMVRLLVVCLLMGLPPVFSHLY